MHRWLSIAYSIPFHGLERTHMGGGGECELSLNTTHTHAPVCADKRLSHSIYNTYSVHCMLCSFLPAHHECSAGNNISRMNKISYDIYTCQLLSSSPHTATYKAKSSEGMCTHAHTLSEIITRLLALRYSSSLLSSTLYTVHELNAGTKSRDAIKCSPKVEDGRNT
jgi:hypothetical protein